MTTEFNPYDRINFEGPLEPVLERATAAFNLGAFVSHEVITIGYEDFNTRITSDQGDYFVKIFASSRKSAELHRYDGMLRAIQRSEVQFPPLHEAAKKLIFHDVASGLHMIAMDYIPGKTFYEDGRRVPTGPETGEILRQTVLIGAIDHHPTFLYDTWDISNIGTIYNEVEPLLSRGEKAIVQRINAELEALDKTGLPHCFVHGDLTKTNVLKADTGALYVLDFSVANWHPRIQELGVVIGNLLNSPEKQDFLSILKQVVQGYVEAGGTLTVAEATALPVFARAAYAAEFLCATRQKMLFGDNTVETKYWLELGRQGLARAFA